MKNSRLSRALIIKILRSHPEGLTLTSIAELCRMHRHTATKYIYELRGAGLISEREVGSAKLCYLKENLSKAEEKLALKRLNGENRKKSTAGQAQLLTILLFLFLIPSTIIIAQNSTLNESFTGMVIDNGSLEQTLSEEPLVTEPVQETISIESNFDDVFESIEEVIQNETESNETETDQTFYEIPQNTPVNETQTEPNETDQTLPETPENITDEIPADLNQTETPSEIPEENITDNETSQKPEINITLPETPMLVVGIDSPERLVWGKEFLITAYVNNTGSAAAKNTVLDWGLPEGLEIIEGSASKECGDLLPESSCLSEIKVMASLSVPLGLNEIKVLVRYLD